MLPLSVLYVLSDMLYPVVYYVVRYRRKVVRKNIRLAFPEKSEKEIIKIEKKFYHFFCDLFLEVIKFSEISEKTLKHIYRIDVNAILDVLNSGKSVMLMTAHYGNWEWGSSLPLFLDKKYFVCNIYKELKDKKFGELMDKLRSRFGAKNIEVKKLLREMLRMRNNAQPAVFNMIADQRPPRNSIHHRMNFLNCDTAVLTGTEELARKFDYPVVFCYINRPKRGFYGVELVQVIEQPSKLNKFEITERYFAFLEQKIREHPEFWLWTHNRWKF